MFEAVYQRQCPLANVTFRIFLTVLIDHVHAAKKRIRWNIPCPMITRKSELGNALKLTLVRLASTQGVEEKPKALLKKVFPPLIFGIWAARNEATWACLGAHICQRH